MIVIEGHIQCPFCGKRVEEIEYTAYSSRKHKLRIPKELRLVDEKIFSESYRFPCCNSEVGTSELRAGYLTLRMLLAEEVLLLPESSIKKEIDVDGVSFYAFKWKNNLYISGEWMQKVAGINRGLKHEVFIPIYRIDVFRMKYPTISGALNRIVEQRLQNHAQVLSQEDFVVRR